jgi:hypothetical protein
MLGINVHADLSLIIDLNYYERIENFRKAIQNWKRRILIPIGTIAVIKSLLISSLNHLFLSLPNPSEDVITLFNKMFYDFIWQGNVKIKSSVIIKNYDEGGLQMINISALIMPLKITWFKKNNLKF